MNWFTRKIIYIVIAIAGVVLAGFGVVSTDQADQISEQALEVVPSLLAVIASGYAAAKTHPGSDSTVTAEDVAQAAAAPLYAEPTGRHSATGGGETTSDYAARMRGENREGAFQTR